MRWIPRAIAPQLIEVARTFPVVVLVGPRQIGKTSLLERLFGDYRYAPLDLAAHAEMAETRPEEFLERFPPPVLLDEVQYAPSLFRHIKTLVDRRRGQNGLFVLTGSQSFPLMEAVADSLAGRASVIPFQSLSAQEWAASRPSPPSVSDWREFVWRGGFPALWSTEVSRDRWYQGYVATYLERDVRNLLNVGSLRDFERFLRASAARAAQSLNLSELARDVGISVPTSKQWLSVLQASGQVLLLEPYHRSLGKRLVKTPKLYFADTGLAAFLMGFGSADTLWRSASAGALFENHVIVQWLRWRDWFQPSAGLWYWRNQSGHEVDLLIEFDGRLHAIEVKLSEKPERRAAHGIERLAAFYGDEQIGCRRIACTTALPFELDGHATAMPGWTTWDLSSPQP